MKMMLAVVVLLATAACGGKNPIEPSTGPTPGGQPAATNALSFNFIRSCTIGDSAQPAAASVMRPMFEIPQCTQGPANSFGMVVSAADLMNAIQLTRPLKDGESWSGALLWVKTFATPSKQYVTNVPFVPGETDHFSFPNIEADSVDVALMLQPGGTIEKVDIVFDVSQLSISPGGVYSWRRADSAHQNRERIVGPLPK
jgi:hypothetical protein